MLQRSLHGFYQFKIYPPFQWVIDGHKCRVVFWDLGENFFTFLVVSQVVDVNIEEVGQLDNCLGNLSFDGIPVIKKRLNYWINFLTESNYLSKIWKDDFALFCGDKVGLVERNLDLIDDKFDIIDVIFLGGDPFLDYFIAIVCLFEEIFVL